MDEGSKFHATIALEPAGVPRRAYPGVLLRCPACGAKFALQDSTYSFDFLTHDGALQHRRFFLCGPCSVLATSGGRPGRRLIRRAVQYISGKSHAAH